MAENFTKIKHKQKTDDGEVLYSNWTSSQTVEMDDGTTVESKLSSMQTDIDGKAPTDHTHSQYLTSITSQQVTDALGYTPVQTDTNTTYTVSSGTSNGQIKVTPSEGNAYDVSVKGLGSAAYTDSTDYVSSSVLGDQVTYNLVGTTLYITSK